MSQVRIDQADMDKLQKNSKNPQSTQKKKTSVGTIIFRVACALIAVAYFVLLFFGKFFMDANGEFLTSINPFSKAETYNNWLRLAGLTVLVLTISFVARFLLGKLINLKKVSKKFNVALVELLANLVKYAAYLVIVFMLLQAFGVNTGEILAGLGILALILGLGVTSLVEDIVAGIFIIIERTFDVGDIIVVDGFRGTVVMIGIRSTKIADIGGDILTLRNSSIGSVVNLTDRMSCVATTIPIAPEESIEHVEEIIKNAHIEKIAEKSPKIQGTPIYLGLYDITKKGVQLIMFIAPCKEEDRYDVERLMFHELKILFESNGVKLGAAPNGSIIYDDED